MRNLELGRKLLRSYQRGWSVECCFPFSFSLHRALAAEADRSPPSSFQTGDGSIQRTYRSVDVQPIPEKTGFHVLLDKRVLRTPNNSPLIIPTHALALAIGAEWEWQSERKVHPATMPLMTLASTAVDQPKPRVFLVEEMEYYVYTDPVLCRDRDPKLRDRQDKMFYPLQAWAERFFSVRFNVSNTIQGSEQSPATVDRVRYFLGSLEPWKLASLHSMVLDAKSLLIGTALFHEHITVRGAMMASRVEEESQIEEWGQVEGGHDIDTSTLYMKLVAASVFLKLLRI